MSKSSVLTPCVVCSTPTDHYCGHCGTTAYCGNQCRDKDWVASHRVTCEKHLLVEGRSTAQKKTTSALGPKPKHRPELQQPTEFVAIDDNATSTDESDQTDSESDEIPTTNSGLPLYKTTTPEQRKKRGTLRRLRRAFADYVYSQEKKPDRKAKHDEFLWQLYHAWQVLADGVETPALKELKRVIERVENSTNKDGTPNMRALSVKKRGEVYDAFENAFAELVKLSGMSGVTMRATRAIDPAILEKEKAWREWMKANAPPDSPYQYPFDE